jgi:hypothetical protein
LVGVVVVRAVVARAGLERTLAQGRVAKVVAIGVGAGVDAVGEPVVVGVVLFRAEEAELDGERAVDRPPAQYGVGSSVPVAVARSTLSKKRLTLSSGTTVAFSQASLAGTARATGGQRQETARAAASAWRLRGMNVRTTLDRPEVLGLS